MCDDNYTDFWIKKLLPEYKFTGDYVFLREDECVDAQVVAESCRGIGFTDEVIINISEWLKGEEISAKNTGVTDCIVLIHKVDGKIAGISCTGIYSHDSEKGAVVWVRMIAAAPEYQGQGIGRNLLMQTLQYGVEHGAKRAFLHVDLENKNAVKLYESIGFVRD
jgi:ribosomal protein S18 acetylase RimI-like enzyme